MGFSGQHLVRPLLAAPLAAALLSSPATALTLVEALAHAYENNDQLAAAREGQKATDEALPQAKANWFRPTVTISGQEGREYIHENEDVEGFDSVANLEGQKETTDTTIRQLGYSVTLPLYRGGQTEAAINAAKAEIGAGQASLTSTEQSLFFDVISAYADIVYYTRVVTIGETEIKELSDQAVLTQQQYEARRRTLADAGYARDAVAQAKATQSTNRGALHAAMANFEAIVGLPPGELENNPGLENMPESLEAALSVALIDNPDLRAASKSIDEYAATVRQYTGELLPEIDLYHSFTRAWDKSKYAGSRFLTDSTSPYDTKTREDTFEIGVELSMDLYEGGGTYSAIREAKATLSEARRTYAYTRSTVEGDVKAHWEELVAAHETLQQYRDSVRELEAVVDGFRQLYRRDDITITTLIDTIQRRNASRRLVANAERLQLLAETRLLQDMGRLTAAGQELPVTLYDPGRNLREVENKWIGLGD